MATTGELFGLFWDSENKDRTYSAASFEYWLKKFFTSGVFNGDLQVQATSGMTVKVGAGYANVDGKVKFWNAEFNLTLSAANSTYPRIDTIVITRDNVNRQITCEVVTGVYTADEPQPTAPVRNPEIYQLILAQIYVAAGATGITQSDITDTRTDTDLCGYITGTVTEMDFSQFTAQFEAYFAEYKLGFEADMSEWESSQQASYATWFNSIVQQYISDKSDWDSWYADLQATLHMLPQDSAEYLQVEINELRDLSSGSIINIDTIEPTLIGQAVTLSSEDGLQIKTAVFEKYRNKLENEGESETINGITFTVNADGTVTANGTATAEARFYINESFTAANGDVLNGCPENGSAVSYQLRVGSATDDTAVGIDVGSGYTMSAGTYKISINIASGRTVNNLVFKPMVRDAADSDEYEKYSSAKAHATIKGVTFVGNLKLASTDSIYTAKATLNTPYYSLYHVDMEFWIANVDIQGDTTLYGATVTVKDSDDVTVGTVTLSSLDGTGSIELTKPDTYTFSTIYEGETITETLVVTAETTYSVELATGFMWARWVTHGGLDPTDYTDLEDVFADEVAVRRLMTIHASADYLIDCVTDDVDEIDVFTANDTAMKWIGLRDYVCDGLTDITGVEAKFLASQYWERYLKDHVPVMTSNTAPYGSCGGANVHSSSNYFVAFNGNITGTSASDYFVNSGNNVDGFYVYYKFTNPICVKKLMVMHAVRANEQLLATFKFQYSDDGSNWTNVDEDIYTTQNRTSGAVEYFDFENNDYHLYYRLYALTSTGGQYCSIQELQFYGRSVDVSVPVMTSNTAPYGIASASGESSGYGAFKAFDGSEAGGSQWASGQTTAPQWLMYDFGNPINIKKLQMRFVDVNTSASCIIEASNDGTDFESIDTLTVSGATRTWKDIANDDVYRYWRLKITAQTMSQSGFSIGQIATLQFYGVDYTEKEFETGSTKKWLYDHGVELETLATKDNSVIGDDYIQIRASSSTYHGMVITDSTLDLTDYSLVRVKLGDIMSGGIQVQSSTGNTSSTDGRISYVKYTSSSNASYLPNNLYLDVSAINQNAYLNMVAESPSINIDVEEWWLE